MDKSYLIIGFSLIVCLLIILLDIRSDIADISIKQTSVENYLMNEADACLDFSNYYPLKAQ